MSSLPPSHILVPPAPEPAPCSSFHYLFGVWATAPHWSPCPVLSCPPIRPLRGLCRISLKPSQVLLLPSFGWGGSWDPRTPASSLIAPQLIPLCKPLPIVPRHPKYFLAHTLVPWPPPPGHTVISVCVHNFYAVCISPTTGTASCASLPPRRPFPSQATALSKLADGPRAHL